MSGLCETGRRARRRLTNSLTSRPPIPRELARLRMVAGGEQDTHPVVVHMLDDMARIGAACGEFAMSIQTRIPLSQCLSNRAPSKPSHRDRLSP